MGIVFNADEVLTMAEQIEKNGASFYRKAAENMEGDQKNLLIRLAEMEDGHEKTFAHMKVDLSEGDKGKTIADPDNLMAQYLKEMANGSVFDMNKNPADTLTGKESFQEILNIAIGLEKDSIIFYVGMKEMVPADLGADKIDAIIKEEMKHISLLSKELKSA